MTVIGALLTVIGVVLVSLASVSVFVEWRRRRLPFIADALDLLCRVKCSACGVTRWSWTRCPCPGARR